ncbi:MAG TPA: DUF3761 domain-containing protein [Gaiellaceae bacterium]|jgi:hypothetical protein|nr:DUF3761 domain-containing protein [Gaiellaceae bacterium]
MRRAAAAVLIATTVALGLCSGRAGAAAPPGATAQCRDGSYSYSQTHSGTCSYHGGVAVWLGAGAAAAASPALGATVLLAPRRAAGPCVRGPRPDRRCSPGAFYSGLGTAVVCGGSFRTGAVRNVPQAEKYAVEREYGLPARLYGRTIEIDHVVPLELGGANDLANLFPEPGSGAASYHAKDALENRVHDLVCAGRMTLRVAQSRIASNWETLFAQVFGAPPR